MKPIDKPNLYKAALKEWGYISQFGMCQEECAELIVAISKHGRSKVGTPEYRKALDNLAEEVADVMIMCEQMDAIIGQGLVEKHMVTKLNRLDQTLKNKEKF